MKQEVIPTGTVKLLAEARILNLELSSKTMYGILGWHHYISRAVKIEELWLGEILSF